MPEIKDVLDDVQREVKKFGEDVKGLKSSMETDLAAVRRLAEDAGKRVNTDPQLKSDLEALTAGVAEKHASIEKTVAEIKAQADQVATALSRAPRGGAPGETDERKAALAFYEAKAVALGQLSIGNRPTAEKVDLDGYKSWVGAFDSYVRRDERAVEAKALSVGSDPNGGYLVPTAMSARIITKVYESSPLRGLATVETIGTSELEIPIDEDEAACGWVGETDDRPQTGTPQIGVQKIAVHEIYAKPRATQKMLEDASINVEGWLANKTGEKFARVEASSFMTGSGIKMPRGILTYPAGAGRGKVQQVNSGHATQITADGLVLISFSLKEPYLANAGWLMKRGTVAQVMILKDSQGQYLWRPGLEAGKPSILLGYPVRQADDMPVVGAGALPVAFGDFRAAYTIVDRLGITTLRDPLTVKPFVEFYSRKRVGGDVVNFEAYALMVVSA